MLNTLGIWSNNECVPVLDLRKHCIQAQWDCDEIVLSPVI